MEQLNEPIPITSQLYSWIEAALQHTNPLVDYGASVNKVWLAIQDTLARTHGGVRTWRYDMQPIIFVNVRLDRADSKRFATWQEDNREHLETLLDELVVAGNRLSATFDGKNSCFIVSITNRIEGDPNKNCCFSSRSDTLDEAIWLAMYKFHVLLNGSVWTEQAEATNWG